MTSTLMKTRNIMTSSFRAEMEVFLNCQDSARDRNPRHNSMCVLLFSISIRKIYKWIRLKISDGRYGEMAPPGNRDNPSSERACGHEASEVHFGKCKIPLIPILAPPSDDAIYLSAPVPRSIRQSRGQPLFTLGDNSLTQRG